MNICTIGLKIAPAATVLAIVSAIAVPAQILPKGPEIDSSWDYL
jgi:hypothetical protein